MAKHKKKVLKNSLPKKMWHPTPLKGSFMLIAILGFFVSAYIVYVEVSKDFGIAFMLVFVLMFIASLISMTKAPVVEV